MTDLRDRFRMLDELDAPTLWPEIESKAVATPPRTDSTRLWALVGVTVLLIVAVSGAALVGSGAIDLPVVPVLPDPVSTPDPNAVAGWTATGDLVVPRPAGHSVTLLHNGMVLVAGGGFYGSQPVASAELFDPESMTWTSTGDMLTARGGHTATPLADRSVLVVGGSDQTSNNGLTFRTAEVYDPATGTWTATGSMAQTRVAHTATLLRDGRVLVAGGHTGSGNEWLDSAELYDPATGIWTTTQSLAQARGSHSATLLTDGRVLVVGGVVGDGPRCCRPLSTAELFDPRDESWTPTGSMVRLGGGSTATLLPDGRVFVGGQINEGTVPTGELYDPVSGSWTQVPNMVEPRYGFSATLLRDSRILVAGGATGDMPGDLLATAELFDPDTGSWIPVPRMNTLRGSHVAIGLADGRVLIVGGLSQGRGSLLGADVLSDPAAEIFDLDGGG